jgi:soluble lytic murein transglycosylase
MLMTEVIVMVTDRRARWLVSSAAVFTLALGIFMHQASQHVLRPTELKEVAKNRFDAVTELSEADRATYQYIFEMQEKANWADADAALKAVENDALKGYVLAQRYLHRRYTSNPKELSRWLEDYADLPQAGRIHALAVRKGVRNAPVIESTGSLKGYGETQSSERFGDYLLSKYHRWAPGSAQDSYWHNIKDAAAANSQGSYKMLADAKKLFDTRDYDLVRWAVANRYFNNRNYQGAYDLAAASARSSGKELPSLHWMAGIAAWKLRDTKTAYHHFAAMAQGKQNLTSWDAAAAAFWAARAAEKLGNDNQALRFYKLAASHPRSFYGLQANKKLDQDLPLQLSTEALNLDDLESLFEEPAAQRISALADLGMKQEAEEEIRRLYVSVEDDEKPAVLALALLKDLPAAQLRIGLDLNRREAGYDFALYPTPNWQPHSGYNVDPALVYAIARQESGFHDAAASHAGATGMMQIMPATAKYILTRSDNATRKAAQQWQEAQNNITLGQRYIDYLINKPYIDGNLIYLAIAYNAGPGNLLKIKREMGAMEDPLLFIETIPYTETRDYVLNIMTNFWMYNAILELKDETQTAMLEGNWPTYDREGDNLAADGEWINRRIELAGLLP